MYTHQNDFSKSAFFILEVIMGRAGAKKICPLAGPGLNLGRIFVSKARYFGPGFCGPKRAGPKNRLKSRF